MGKATQGSAPFGAEQEGLKGTLKCGGTGMVKTESTGLKKLL
jgi:hypothetical protein